MRTVLILLFGVVAACTPASHGAGVRAGAPMRVVSLDYCADQFVLRFVERERIAAVSPDATAPYSYMREAAAGLPAVRPRAEDVLILRPDLIVRSYGGGPNAAAYFERLGIPVVDVGYAADIEGVMANVERLAGELGAPEEGKRVTRDMRARLSGMTQTDEAVLYMTPGGVTTGPGSLIHELIVAAGYRNFEERPGWHALPLERLTRSAPDRIAAAFFGETAAPVHAWSATRHPVARAQLRERPVVTLDSAWTTCGGWFLVDAVEALREGGSE